MPNAAKMCLVVAIDAALLFCAAIFAVVAKLGVDMASGDSLHRGAAPTPNVLLTFLFLSLVVAPSVYFVLKGKLNVLEVDPDLHRRAARAAERAGPDLTRFAAEALESAVDAQRKWAK